MSQGVILKYKSNNFIKPSEIKLHGGKCLLLNNLFGKEIHASYTPPTIESPDMVSVPFNIGSIITGQMASSIYSLHISTHNYEDTQIIVELLLIDTILNTHPIGIKPIYAVYKSGQNLPTEITASSITSHFTKDLQNYKKKLSNNNLDLKINKIIVDSIKHSTLTTQTEHKTEHFTFDNMNMYNSTYIYILLIILFIVICIYIYKYK